ncbi:SET domain-containing protein [Gammaproteobacteria bacterium]|nr:SET domain-containing protein [Gammaproteobacteria bacterium]
MPTTVYVADSPIHGKGLFAGTHIPAGAVIGLIRGIPCKRDGAYVLWISADEAIEVTCDLRYINHSDEPNACYYDDLSVSALRDIQPHEEITHDYASNDW